MENKKTKLTISGSSKKTFKNFDTSKSQGIYGFTFNADAIDLSDLSERL